MRKSGQAALLAVVLPAVADPAAAQSIVNLKGIWAGPVEAIVDGPANHHPAPGAAGTRPAGNHRLSDLSFTLTIEGQDGRRFWGTTSSAGKSERLMGSLSVDGKSIHMVDDDGFLDGTLTDAGTMDLCYRHITATSAVVACSQLKRK